MVSDVLASGHEVGLYRSLGWIGAAAVLAVALLVVWRVDVAPRTYAVVRVAGATSLVLLAASAVEAFASFVGRVVVEEGIPDRGASAVLLALGAIAGFAGGWHSTVGDRGTGPEELLAESAVAADGGVEDEQFEVPPLVPLDEIVARARSYYVFGAVVAGAVASVLLRGLARVGGGLGGSLDLDPYLGVPAYAIAGTLLGLAVVTPILLREDELGIRPAVIGLVVVAIAAGLYQHVASAVHGPTAALLAGLAPGLLAAPTLLLVSELREFASVRAVWVGTTLTALVAAVGAACALYALQRSNPGVFFPDISRVNCPPTCPPDNPMDRAPELSPTRVPSPTELPSLPPGFPTELLPSWFTPRPSPT